MRLSRIAQCFGSFFVAAAILIFFSSCGYTNRKSDIALNDKVSGPQRVFVPVFDNLTTRPGLEAMLTNALREALGSAQGIVLVNDPQSADFFLLGYLTSYSRRHIGESAKGTEGTENEGGLLTGQHTAASIELGLGVNIRFMQRGADEKIRRQLWSRSFEQIASYETSQRFSEKGGSSSAPHINESRENLQVQILAQRLARQVLDQVTQDF